MNHVLVFVLLSFCPVGVDPVKVMAPLAAEAAQEANDPTLISLGQTLALLNESLFDAAAKTPHPEISSKVKKLLGKIRKVEAAIVARRVMLRSSPRVMPLPPVPSRDRSIMVL